MRRAADEVDPATCGLQRAVVDAEVRRELFALAWTLAGAVVVACFWCGAYSDASLVFVSAIAATVVVLGSSLAFLRLAPGFDDDHDGHPRRPARYGGGKAMYVAAWTALTSSSIALLPAYWLLLRIGTRAL